ncbi:MAG: hypothetical protein COV98_02410 [Candidatus Altarchaeum sp. CG12_big_fil_rev_8_21_14_0_65_33_22]|mgnify:CR=1 FL=1|nr:MAG: hypothetical protein AUK59_03635 [Candidatus Altarchaeum sp. CG2_30_32_3053]PIN67565.1 MAG: hypothetical protein COV98_02410 [Candidatus Altarchaeum sp. CG12_big_fil_rev_8_21_14_0_65_33_22]PIV28922.1 MAG: hypothetical protein COS36_00495 [Candidatus Altarchaeum sp. CG03_land_8_20_14_0_80_32_618]PIX49551.1 MAG: hypothetical protein COZ53_00275 [Candidatus Altarchaeum sp. CG_4_8_14_3_um_filter_33_2054]PIZ33267.1 MAG: hypothetical protein COY41_00070 [Candidatus Altarchaeum sp. CG_4_10_14_
MDFKYKKMEIETEIVKLKKLLEKEVNKDINDGCDGILLSAGLDTSILSYLAAKKTKNFKAFTLKFGNHAPDAEYAEKLCQILNIEHHLLEADEEILMKNLREAIKISGVFDPMEIRNSVAIYTILKFSKDYVRGVMTGDGADELFFGYDFLIKMKKDERKFYAKNMWKTMHFSSNDMGRFFGIKIWTPYLSGEVKNYAISLDDDVKINGSVGKWILRKAYENLLPKEFIMREKTPIEYGSGTTLLTNIFENKISDEVFIKKKSEYKESDGAIIRDKEHLYYYEIYREIFGKVKEAKQDEIKCAGCGIGIEHKKAFCRICGTMNGF